MRTVSMTHPDLDAVIDVPESAVPIHRAAGWDSVDTSHPQSTRPTSVIPDDEPTEE